MMMPEDALKAARPENEPAIGDIAAIMDAACVDRVVRTGALT
jgi:hypothetical protein